MSRIVRLEPGPLSAETIATLQSGRAVLSERDPLTEARLQGASIEYRVAEESLDPDEILILVRRPMDELAYICDRLLGPGGCPWDQAQTHESLKKHVIEEAYEVLDAIDSGSVDALREELGDLLLQPVLHAQMRKLRTQEFDIDDVARGIVEKLVRRHPHVFGDLSVADSDEVLKNWDRIKKQEKADTEPDRSILDGVPRSLPALLRAYEVSKRAVRAGFEWPDLEGVLSKLAEEAKEVQDAVATGDIEQIESELADLLFTVVNISRWLKIEPEEALRKMVDRFAARFKIMEKLAPCPLTELSLAQWDELWVQAKALSASPHG